MNTVLACFPDGKTKCLTMSYDDGVRQDRRLVEIFNRNGVKGTFHLNSAYLGIDQPFGTERCVRQSEIAELYRGHEVSCHTATHPAISRCPLPAVAAEILDDRKALESLAGYPVRGMSYPYGSHSAAIRALLPSLGICYARVVGDSFDFGMPADFLQWKATCHHNHRLMEMAEAFNAPDHGVHLKLFYVWGHSCEFDHNDNWSMIEDFCAMMGGRGDTWFATNIEIYDCMQAFAQLRFSADNSFVHNPSAASAWVRVNGGEPTEIKGGALAQLG